MKLLIDPRIALLDRTSHLLPSGEVDYEPPLSASSREHGGVGRAADITSLKRARFGVLRARGALAGALFLAAVQHFHDHR